MRAGLVPLYPMGVGDVLDTAFRLLRATARGSALLVVLLLGPIALLSSVGYVSPLEMFSGPVTETPDTHVLVLAGIASILTFVVQPLLMAALVWLGARTDEGAAPSWQDAFRGGWRRYGAVLGAFALLALVLIAGGVVVALVIGFLGLMTAGLALLLFIPLILVAGIAMVFALILGHLVVPVAVVEERGPVQSIRRAWTLMRPRFWPVVGYSLLVGLVVQLLSLAVSAIVTIAALLGDAANIPGAFLFVALGTLLDGLVTISLASFAALAIYVDLRIRTEGYDVAVLAAELRR